MKVKSSVSSGRQNTLHSNSVCEKGHENTLPKIVQSMGLFSWSLSIVSTFYYCHYYYSTLGIFFFHLTKKNAIISFFLLAWDYLGATQRIFHNEKVLRGTATFGKVKLLKQFYQTKFMSHKHAATAKKKLKNKAFSFPISNIHTDTDLGIKLFAAVRLLEQQSVPWDWRVTIYKRM